MKVTLHQATKLMLKDIPKSREKIFFRNIIKGVISVSGNNRTYLREGQIVEISAYGITVSFSWEMISVVFEGTNQYVDILSIHDGGIHNVKRS